MKYNFNQRVKKLHEVASRFDADSNRLKLSLIKEIAKNKITFAKQLTSYYEILLFIMSFPPDRNTFDVAEKEVNRLGTLLKKQREKVRMGFLNSGIPHAQFYASFSHDCTRWLLDHPDCSVSIYSIENSTHDLNEALKVTVPSVQRSVTTAGYNNDELLNELAPDKKNRLRYIVDELSRLDETPFIKDHYYDGLGILLDIIPKNILFSKAYNRIEIPQTFYHEEIIKHFDVAELLDRKLPPEAVLTDRERERLVRVIKNSQAMTERETDPVTYMNEDSLRLFHLERGVSIAIYGMPQPRQLPLESYIGYTMFKNGYPAAYAGGWVFGHRADYGLNIYDQFRGGESAYMVAQILRLYRQLFEVNYFQVEATQFGLDSPEGIETGVFWFYHKLGFRPVDMKLRQLAKKEHEKITANKGYRSPAKTLIKFTESEIFMNLGKSIPTGVYDITSKVKQMILKKYRSDSSLAEKSCVEEFLSKTNNNQIFSKEEYSVLKEVSLWASALNISDTYKLNLMSEMIKLKPVDEYLYQEKLRLFF